MNSNPLPNGFWISFNAFWLKPSFSVWEVWCWRENAQRTNNKRRHFCTIACFLAKDLAVCFRLEMANWGDWRISSCIFFGFGEHRILRLMMIMMDWDHLGFSAVSNLQLKNLGFTVFGKCALPPPPPPVFRVLFSIFLGLGLWVWQRLTVLNSVCCCGEEEDFLT